MLTFMVFLVMLIPDTDKPTLVLMAPFHTAKECNAVLEKAPAEHKDKFACIRVDTGPLKDEGESV